MLRQIFFLRKQTRTEIYEKSFYKHRYLPIMLPELLRTNFALIYLSAWMTTFHQYQLDNSKRIRKKEHLYLVSNKLKVWKLSSLKTRKKCPAHDDNDDEVNNRHTMDSEGTMESIRKLNKSFETTYVLQYIYRADRETTETWKSFNLV